MRTFRTQMLGLMGLMSVVLMSTVSARANDIVDFLRAVNGISDSRHDRGAAHPAGQRGQFSSGVHQAGYGDRNFSSRDIYKRSQQVASRDLAGRDVHSLDHWSGSSHVNRGGYDPHRVDLRHGNWNRNDIGRSGWGRSGLGHPSSVQRSGARISFHVSSGGSSNFGQPLYIPAQEPVQVLPPVQEFQNPALGFPTVPSHPVAPVFPHQVGEIVDCHVPLATCVRVEDEHNIAPNAVPIVVAVRDPNTCGHQFQERIVFVQVFVPPCPPRSIRVSPCHSRVTMDFGQYEVDIKSQNGLIFVDYDN